MSEWTLGAVKAHNMEINALCENEACRHLFTFNLDALIEGVGADLSSQTLRPWTARDAGWDRLPPGFRLSIRARRRESVTHGSLNRISDLQRWDKVGGES